VAQRGGTLRLVLHFQWQVRRGSHIATALRARLLGHRSAFSHFPAARFAVCMCALHTGDGRRTATCGIPREGCHGVYASRLHFVRKLCIRRADVVYTCLYTCEKVSDRKRPEKFEKRKTMTVMMTRDNNRRRHRRRHR